MKTWLSMLLCAGLGAGAARAQQESGGAHGPGGTDGHERRALDDDRTRRPVDEVDPTLEQETRDGRRLDDEDPRLRDEDSRPNDGLREAPPATDRVGVDEGDDADRPRDRGESRAGPLPADDDDGTRPEDRTVPAGARRTGETGALSDDEERARRLGDEAEEGARDDAIAPVDSPAQGGVFRGDAEEELRRLRSRQGDAGAGRSGDEAEEELRRLQREDGAAGETDGEEELERLRQRQGGTGDEAEEELRRLRERQGGEADNQLRQDQAQRARQADQDQAGAEPGVMEPAPFKKLEWQPFVADVPELSDALQVAIVPVGDVQAKGRQYVRATRRVHLPRHVRSANETIVVLQGQATFVCEGTRGQVTLGPGDMTYIPGEVVREAWLIGGTMLFSATDGNWDVTWSDGPPTRADLDVEAPAPGEEPAGGFQPGANDQGTREQPRDLAPPDEEERRDEAPRSNAPATPRDGAGVPKTDRERAVDRADAPRHGDGSAQDRSIDGVVPPPSRDSTDGVDRSREAGDRPRR